MRKPRESKYQKMIGKKINEVYTDFQMRLESENYEITGYIPGGEPRISRSGRRYKVYKVQLENSVWISTQMFNKYVKRGLFSKNVHRKIDNARIFERFNESINNEFEPVIEVVKPVEVKEEPTKYEIELTSVMWRTVGKRTTEVERAINDMTNIDDINELKKYWRTECKKFHPDHGGNAEDFAEVRFWYEEELRNIESIQTALDEILNEPVDELHDLKTTYNLKDLKNAYRVLVRKYHPDNLETGDSDRFKLVKTIYDVRKLMIEEILEVFGYDDPNFAELVDMTEDLHKSLHKIVY